MDINETKKSVVQNAKRYGLEFGINIDRDFAVLKLVEEVGELAEAILNYENKSRPEKRKPKNVMKAALAAELADVIGMALVLSDIYDLDIENTLNEKWINKQRK